MARTLFALLAIVACLAAGTWAQSVCNYVDDCMEDFRIKAKGIAHDHGEYCELQRQELECAETVFPSCPSDTRTFAQIQIDRMRAEQKTCGCSSIVSSTLLLSLAAVIIRFLNSYT